MGFNEAGIAPVMHCEFDKQAASVLRFHYPDVPFVSDIHDLHLEHGSIDILIGGIPCQDYSVAGKRAGLAGDKGAIFWQFHRLASEARPRIAIIENVPGILSSDSGRSFATILAAMAELGYRWAYRTLDAQYFGVPQRRRRVFIVFSLGYYSCAEILFEPGCLPRHHPKGEEARKEVAGTLGGGSGVRGWTTSTDSCGAFIPELANCLSTSNERIDFETETFIPQVTHSLTANGFDASEDGTGRGTPIVAFDPRQVTSPHNRSNPQSGGPCHTLHTGAPMIAYGIDGDANANLINAMKAKASGSIQNGAVAQGMSVRRLTPTECERLMGWPDDWCKYGAVKRGKKPRRYSTGETMLINGELHDIVEMADGPRYRMCGNGVVGPVSAWLANRIVSVMR